VEPVAGLAGAAGALGRALHDWYGISTEEPQDADAVDQRLRRVREAVEESRLRGQAEPVVKARADALDRVVSVVQALAQRGVEAALRNEVLAELERSESQAFALWRPSAAEGAPLDFAVRHLARDIAALLHLDAASREAETARGDPGNGVGAWRRSPNGSRRSRAGTARFPTKRSCSAP
jgi:hypothetical protein